MFLFCFLKLCKPATNENISIFKNYDHKEMELRFLEITPEILNLQKFTGRDTWITFLRKSFIEFKKILKNLSLYKSDKFIPKTHSKRKELEALLVGVTNLIFKDIFCEFEDTLFKERLILTDKFVIRKECVRYFIYKLFINKNVINNDKISRHYYNITRIDNPSKIYRSVSCAYSNIISALIRYIN